MTKKQNQQTSLVPAWLSRAGFGFVSGLVGAMTLGIVFILGWSILADILQPPPPEIDELGRLAVAAEPHALFGVVAVLAIFISTLVSAIVHTILRTLGQADTLRRSVLAQVFLVHLGLLLGLLPGYIFSAVSDNPLSRVTLVAGVHVLLSLLGGQLAYSIEQSEDTLHPLLPVYATLGGLCLLTWALVLMLGTSPMLLVLAVLPLGHALMPAGHMAVLSLYAWFRGTLGIEVLSTAEYDTESDDDDDEYAAL